MIVIDLISLGYTYTSRCFTMALAILVVAASAAVAAIATIAALVALAAFAEGTVKAALMAYFTGFYLRLGAS